MKKIFILLFLPFLGFSQAVFDEGIQNTAAPTDTTPAYFTTSQTDGVHKKTPAALIATKSELDLKQTVFTGIDQKQYLTENDFVIDNSALTLTISTVKNGTAISAINPIRFYTDGSGMADMHEKISAVTFNFTNTTGIWYFYFDSSGNPIATQTPWTEFSTIATVYRFYWNATLSVADRRVIEAVEYHKNDVSWIDHAWKHLDGAKWSNGLTISSNAIASGTPAVDGSNAVITLSSGSVLDDNIQYTLTNASTGSVKFTQNLGTGLLPATSGKFICISNNSSGLLEKIPATDFPFLWNSGTNTPEYLTVNGTRTGVTANHFFVYYVYALQDPRHGETIKIKSAELDFNTLTLAQAHNWEQLQTLFPTLRDGEIRLLYKLTFEYRTSYDIGTKKAALRFVDDLRKQKTTTTAVASGTVPATNVSVSPIGNISSTNAQSALEELDSEKENIANKSDSYTASSTITYPNTKALVDGLATKVTASALITGATNTKITYDSKGLVTSGTTLVAGDIPNIAESQVTNLTSDLTLKANLASPTFTGTVSGITKTMVGLGNVDNTADLNKPISTATQAALNLKANINNTYTQTEVDSKIANLNQAYHVDFIDSGTHNFTVPDSIIVQNVYLNNIPVYGADWSQTGTSVAVATSVTGDKVTLTGGNFVSVDLSNYNTNSELNEYAKKPIDLENSTSTEANVVNEISLIPDNSTYPTNWIFAPTNNKILQNGYVNKFNVKLNNTELGRTVKFYVLRQTTGNNYTVIYDSGNVAAELNGINSFTPDFATIKVLTNDIIGVKVNFISSANSIRFYDSGGPDVATTVYYNGIIALGNTYLFSSESNKRQFCIDAEAIGIDLVVSKYWGDKPFGYPVLDENGVVKTGQMPAYLKDDGIHLETAIAEYSPEKESDIIIRKSGQIEKYAHPRPIANLGGNTTFLQNYIIVPYLKSSPGFANDGIITEVRLDGVFSSNVGATIQAWIVRPKNFSLGIFDFVSKIGQLDASLNNRWHVFSGLNIKVKAGDLIAFRVNGAAMRYYSGSAETNLYAAKKVNLADYSMDALNNGLVSLSIQDNILWTVECDITLKSSISSNSANGLLRLGENAEIPNKIGKLCDMPWNQKKIIWVGTSIPAGKSPSYPKSIGKYLNAKVVNEAVGSSGIIWDGTRALSLSATIAELTASFPGYESQSYQNKLIGKAPDLVVFDHGHNDRLQATGAGLGTIDSMDRTTFYGAFNYVINALYADNPNVRIAFVTPPNRYTSNGTETTAMDNTRLAILALANKYGAPVCDLMKLSNFNQYNYALNTDDGTHPTQAMTDKIAIILYNFLKGIN